MSDQISTNQTVPVVSESVSSDNRTICLYMRKEMWRMIEANASVAHMNFNDYMVAAGYDNSLRYQAEQIRLISPYCEECINRISDIKQDWLHDAFQKELFGIRSCVKSLVYEMRRTVLSVWPDNAYLKIPNAAANYEMTVIFTPVTLSTQTYDDFAEYAETLGTDVQSYLLCTATNRSRGFSPVPLETAIPYLRNARQLLGYINDYDLRDALLNNINLMRDAVCKYLTIFETKAY